MTYDMNVEQRTNDRPLLDDNEDYFGLPGLGMSNCFEAMESHGMVAFGERPDWPKRVTYETQEQYEVECEGVRRFRLKQPGLPLRKFCTNDGWYVCPEECRQALDAYDRSWADKGKDPEWFGEWLDFLRHAEKQGGFRVW